MRILQLCIGLYWLAFVAGGVLKKPEDLTDDIPDENAENPYLDDYAANALLTVEERKIVALLERIENKFGTLEENEKVEFVKKISNYQDRFASTLAKVETIPGMYGLDVPMLRINLGIPGTDETLEEIHEDFEYVVNGDHMSEATVEDDVEDFEATVEVVEDLPPLDIARKASLERMAGIPNIQVASKDPQTKKTLDDVYNVMSQLVNLILVQIVQEHNKPEPTVQLPDHFYPAPVARQASRNYRTRPNSAPRPRIPSRIRKQQRFQQALRNKAVKPSNPYTQTPAFNPYVQNPYLAANSYAQDPRLVSLMNSIPPVFNDVSMNLDYSKNKRRRRDAPTPPEADNDALLAQQAAAEEALHEQAEEAAALEAEEAAAHEAEEAALDYEEWYNNTYMPWYYDYQRQMADYQQAMMAYEAAQMRALVPKNPFGDVGFGNPFPFYSKNAYINSLYEDVQDQDPREQYSEEFSKWKCERESDLLAGEACWEPTTALVPGFCGVLSGADCIEEPDSP